MARFVTVIACIDGRVQAPLSAWARERFEADYADMVTRPGCDAVLSAAAVEDVRRDVEVSIRAHDPAAVVVSGHHDCAANPASERHHAEQIVRSVERVATWVPDGVPVVGAFVDESWQVREVS